MLISYRPTLARVFVHTQLLRRWPLLPSCSVVNSSLINYEVRWITNIIIGSSVCHIFVYRTTPDTRLGYRGVVVFVRCCCSYEIDLDRTRPTYTIKYFKSIETYIYMNVCIQVYIYKPSGAIHQATGQVGQLVPR